MNVIISKYKNLIAVCFILVSSIAMYIASFWIKNRLVSGVGSEFVPRVIAITMGILSILAIMEELQRIRSGEYNNISKESAKKDINYKLVLLTVVVITLYIALLEKIGFLIMTVLFLFTTMCMYSKKEERKYILFAVVSICVPLVTYYFFKNAFDVLLPPGILG